MLALRVSPPNCRAGRALLSLALAKGKGPMGQNMAYNQCIAQFITRLLTVPNSVTMYFPDVSGRHRRASPVYQGWPVETGPRPKNSDSRGRQLMSLILLRCPETGFYYSSGVQGDRQTFKLAQDAFANCPHCNRAHKWNNSDIIWIESDRWSEDPQTQSCYISAQESAEKAEAAKTEADRRFWERMEQKWLHLANGYSFISDPRKKD
jgi:hypothetical protein